ncbi:MAG TPA: AMP-binding protein [Solirubrobacteraceae bacterium]|nr:AMP-binding protein [Solirubrobacteraceae bacterium]
MSHAEVTLAHDVMPLGHLLLRSARREPDREALVFPDTRWSYGELADRAWAVARSLVALGVRRGEHVGLLMTNHPDFVATFFGASLAGAVVVPLNARYRRNEVDSIVENADLVALLTHDYADDHIDFAARLHESLPGLAGSPDPLHLSLTRHPMLRAVVMMGRKESDGILSRAAFDGLDGEEFDAALRARVEGLRVRDIAIILYTSGTTSAPRGALLTHEAFVRAWMGTGRIFDTTAEDRHWNGLPLFHVAALGCLTWITGHGATFISDYTWDAGRCLQAMERERVTQFYPAYQPIMEAFLGHPRFADTDLRSLRTFLNTAPPEMLAGFQERLPDAVGMTMYGGTEGGAVTTTQIDDPLEDRINTTGRPQPGLEIRVVGEDGSVLGAGQPGIIQFRGFNTLEGYYKSPEKTVESVLADGWVTMTDLGQMDEKGQVQFLGRAKETLKVGGENVAPQEVEAQLYAHPAVKLAQVVGMPDPKLVEVPAAFVELQDSATATEHELIEHCRGRIASFKVPRLIRFVASDDWPMSATKIQRFALRERLLEEPASRPEMPA